MKNQLYCVTGATSGIGQAVALHLAKTGATLILIGKTATKLNKTADLIIQAGYPEPYCFVLNFIEATEEACIELAVHLGETFQRLDGLIHCAGALGTLTPIAHFPEKTWRDLFQIYVHTPFLLSKNLLPLLKYSQGQLVFTLHTEAIGKAYWGAYSAAQGSLQALLQTLRSEFEHSPELRIFGVDPVKVRTRLRAKAYPGETPTTLPSPSQAAAFYMKILTHPQLESSPTGIYTMDQPWAISS